MVTIDDVDDVFKSFKKCKFFVPLSHWHKCFAAKNEQELFCSFEKLKNQYFSFFFIVTKLFIVFRL